LVDADDPLGEALSQELRRAGHRVTTHSRELDGRTDLHAQDLCVVLDSMVCAGDTFDRVVFGMKGDVERFDTPDDIDCLQVSLSLVLGELQAVVRLLARHENGQVWVLLPEDSMHHYAEVACQPVRTRALIAALKSMAKEVFRLGVRVNALHIQTLAEQLPDAAWRNAQAGLKAYALKFKPRSSVDAARFIHGLLAQPRLPLAGLVLPVGVGFPEAHV